ncbi:L,D-transpeptidase family protein [Parafrankia sp. BMG5.11]|uniref:L,D-transpeptidase family protein n=1 Tax=Parafrankia sp. BMG5.11 TaxID=222540 RepID=UPI00103ED259|nr:L,D-transpeptidase family protein [Parafrankia sp. BMG5.11]TCJ32173.1 hypothetical protein E0504_44350 [Parafrankia sp. BMG5.11]
MRVSIALVILVAALFGVSVWAAGGKTTEVPHSTAAAFHINDPQRIYLSLQERELAATEGLLPVEARSILNIESRLRYGEHVWSDNGVPLGKVHVRVDLKKQIISVFRSGHEIGSAVITYGAKGKDTPSGTFPVLAKMEEHRSSIYDADMPYTLRLTDDGISLHGSDVRWGAATHGCIGLPNEFARRLFREVEVGQAVEIVAHEPHPGTR